LGLNAFTVRCLPSDEDVAQAALHSLLSGLLDGSAAPEAAAPSGRNGPSRAARHRVGLLCRSVVLADAATRAVQSLGLAIPGDVEIAVCNYYAVPGAGPRYPYPRLALSAQEQGAHLGRLLARQAAGEVTQSEHEIIPVTLEVPATSS
jgi:hypothetical protein